MKRMTYVLAAVVLGLAMCTVGAAQARPAITGIAFVRVYASDMAASQRFYGSELGFVATPAEGGLLRYGVSASQWLEVAPQADQQPLDRIALVAFTTRDAAELRRYLEAHHVAITGTLPGGFTVSDPEGNAVGFVQTGVMAGSLKLSRSATSQRIIHAGRIVKSVSAENAFFRDLLGFRPYWHGGHVDGVTDYYSVQVPDGTDWMEYMLNVPPNADARSRGGPNHVSLGVEKMGSVIAALARNGCEAAECKAGKMGRDGKVQLNLFDPDHTRVEFMEFRPSGVICCSAFQGRAPGEREDR